MQAALTVLLAPRIVRAIESLSLRPVQLVPLAAIGAIELGLLVWAAWSRSWNGALSFCLLGLAWWIYFAAEFLQ